MAANREPAARPGPEPVPAPEPERGIRCRRCNCAVLYVLWTRKHWGGKIVRRRECRHCGLKVTTSERVSG